MFPAIEADRTTAAAILQAFVKRLRTKVKIFGEQNCIVSDVPIPPSEAMTEGDLIATVSMGDGVFPDSFWAGGGHDQLVQDSSVTVAVMKRSDTDQPEHADRHLMDPERGFLTVLQPKILSAILIEKATTAAKDRSAYLPWVPMLDGKPMLRNLIKPQTVTAPTPLEGIPLQDSWLFMSIAFEVTFDWRLEG